LGGCRPAGIFLSHAGVAYGTPDSREAIIVNGYSLVLGRGVDPVGDEYWGERLASGTPVSEFLVGLVTSPEYKGSHPYTTTAQFAAHLYITLLQRDGSSSDIEFWGTFSPRYDDIARGFVASAEFRALHPEFRTTLSNCSTGVNDPAVDSGPALGA